MVHCIGVCQQGHKVGPVDVILSIRMTAGLVPAGITREGDADGDDQLGTVEAIMALRKAADLPAE